MADETRQPLVPIMRRDSEIMFEGDRHGTYDNQLFPSEPFEPGQVPAHAGQAVKRRRGFGPDLQYHVGIGLARQDYHFSRAKQPLPARLRDNFFQSHRAGPVDTLIVRRDDGIQFQQAVFAAQDADPVPGSQGQRRTQAAAEIWTEIHFPGWGGFRQFAPAAGDDDKGGRAAFHFTGTFGLRSSKKFFSSVISAICRQCGMERANLAPYCAVRMRGSSTTTAP